MHCLIVYNKLYLVDTSALEQVSYIYNVPFRVEKGPMTQDQLCQLFYICYFCNTAFTTATNENNFARKIRNSGISSVKLSIDHLNRKIHGRKFSSIIL